MFVFNLFCIYVCSDRTKGFGLNEDTENREKSRGNVRYILTYRLFIYRYHE